MIDIDLPKDSDQEKWSVVANAIEDTGLSPDEVLQALNWKMADINCDKGRPSKVDKWEEMIIDEAATLEEAREHMSDPTWYKLKKRVENND